MAEPFLSEIRIMSFVFAPKGWALCNGQLLPINQNQALFSLLGTTYGGDGRVNFALPDLSGPGADPYRQRQYARREERQRNRDDQRSSRCRRTRMCSTHHPLQTNAVLPGGNFLALAPQQAYVGAAQPGGDGAEQRHERRRKPGAPEHAALPDAELLHRPAGHLPVAELRRRPDGTALCG